MSWMAPLTAGAQIARVPTMRLVVGLLALSVYLSIAMWHQVQRLFGL